MSSDLPAAVFISHVSQEAALAALLKNAIARDFPGIDIFVSSDLGSIEVGTDWLPCIEHAINKSSVLIVLCSQDSIRRPWVNFELGAAWMRSIPIVPLCHTDLTPADLPMPLSVKDGLEANSSKELIRLYAVIARTMNVAIPKEHLPCLAKQVAEFEAAYKAANTREVVQFEYHLDLVVPGPGRLPEARIPSETLVESDAKSLELFGLLADGKRTWRDVEKTAKRNRDTRWLAQLQKSVHLASNGESFTPMQAIFHTNLGSYQPELARMDMMPNGSRRFHIHFVKTVVPPLADVPNEFGVLATLLRLGLRFRYEVIERFQDALRVARSIAPSQPTGLDLIAQMRAAIEIIECDADSRGAPEMDTESVVRLFKEPDEQAEVREMQQQWKEIRARLFDDEKPVTLREARRLIADLRDINFRFMVLGTRQLQVSVRKSWALKFAPPAKKSTTRKRLALVPSPALSATDVSNAA